MNKFISGAMLGVCIALTSCIGNEPLNTECDIECVSVHMDVPKQYFYHDYDTMMVVPSTAENIEFEIRASENVAMLPVTLRTTAGAKTFYVKDGNATLFKNGTSLDFSNEQVHHFRIVSEDENYSRNYTLSFVHATPTAGFMFFDFEEFALDQSGKYYEWSVENNPNATFFTDGMWKNGNPGFKLSKSSAKPQEYPSTPVLGGGPDGSTCLKLETQDTGGFGVMVNMRIASGSMFNGKFMVEQALKNALKATQFGSNFDHKPVKMTAWLKFEPGIKFQDKMGNYIPDVIDEPDAYVVMYRNEDENGNKVQLDGNDVLSSRHIVGIGRLPHNYNADGTDKLSNTPIHGLTSEWQFVEIPVIYTKEVDPIALKNKGYNIIIGFASSWQGAYFQGAVGNKFYIDNVSVYCEDSEEIK